MAAAPELLAALRLLDDVNLHEHRQQVDEAINNATKEEA
jgi:hypothetical protein